eukprot:219940-Pleurochrysis_carterae.AAC.1
MRPFQHHFISRPRRRSWSACSWLSRRTPQFLFDSTLGGYPGEGPRPAKVVRNPSGRPGVRGERSRGAERGANRWPTEQAEVAREERSHEEEAAVMVEEGNNDGEEESDDASEDGDGVDVVASRRVGDSVDIDAQFLIILTDSEDAAYFVRHYKNMRAKLRFYRRRANSYAKKKIGAITRGRGKLNSSSSAATARRAGELRQAVENELEGRS